MAKFAVRVSVLLVLLLVALNESSEYGSKKYCCTRYQQKPVPVKWLKRKKSQLQLKHIINTDCHFKTVKNRHICANPEDKWVNIAIPLLSLEGISLHTSSVRVK
uniref:Chemokine interleukin-8-like domain-containing protein n=1 Tax=Oreochromis aureus TaxID=47969 RepID=A0A668RYV9_OREAU